LTEHNGCQELNPDCGTGSLLPGSEFLQNRSRRQGRDRRQQQPWQKPGFPLVAVTEGKELE
jgi:hypothetical protein